MSGVVIGIDVQAARGCPFAVLDTANARIIGSGWMVGNNLTQSVRDLVTRYPDAVFAIDAPRMPLQTPRSWYWRNGRGWTRGNGAVKGKGRHCEVVIKAHGLANPQWTPLVGNAPDWMKHGFEIFDALKRRATTLEVFPSASYRMLDDVNDVRVNIPLAGFLNGPKDMLDAIVAAVTGVEYLAGRGQEVGGGDGLGTIVLPRRIAEPITDVMEWPANNHSRGSPDGA